jgi:hypothetical protein
MEIDMRHAKEKNKLYEIRILEQPFETPANTLIFEDYIALQTLIEPFSVIQIKNEALAKAYLNYFNALWIQGREV